MSVEIELLGEFRVRVDGRPVAGAAWARRDAASLVKVLALQRGRRLHREQLIDVLWPGLGLADAAPRLHKASFYARRALGRPDAVVLSADEVALFPDDTVTVDVAAFEQEASTALAGGSQAAAEAALRRHSGELLPADLYADWAAEARQRVAGLRDRLLWQARRWEELLERDPYDEVVHLELMRDLVRAGDLRGALRQYERLDHALRRDAGAAPGADAVALHEQAKASLMRQGGLTAADAGRLEQQIRFCRTDDGVTLAYALSGGGPPLVKAANWLTHVDHDWHSVVWRHWLVALSARHQLIRYDERGCGLSDWDIAPPTFENWVQDLETVVDTVGLDRFPLLGISQGAGVAIEYAARHPDRVSRLVIYGGYARGRLTRAGSDDDRRRHELQVELARLGWGSDDPAFRQVFTAQFMPEGSKELWEAFNVLQRQTTSAENAARVLDLTGSLDVVETARRVQAPTLVLHARHDHRPPFEEGRLLASLIPDSRFVALESRNHILLADEPAWPVFLEQVQTFLAGS